MRRATLRCRPPLPLTRRCRYFVDLGEERSEVDRFVEHTVGVVRVAGVEQVHFSADQDDRYVTGGLPRAKRFEDLEARAAGHPDIQQDDVWPALFGHVA